MSTCKHSDWLKLWTRGAETGLEVTDRPKRLVQDFRQPFDRHASSLVLIGNKSKHSVFKKLFFSRCSIRAPGNGEFHLLSGVLRDSRRRPLIITDTDVFRRSNRTSPYKRNICHEIASQTFSAEIKHLAFPEIFDHVLQRAILPHADVVCMFVDDIGGMAECLCRIGAWVNKGCANTSATRPRIVLMSSQEMLKQDRKKLRDYLQCHDKTMIERSFSSITILGVPKTSGRGRRRHDQLNRRWRVLGSEISRALELSRQYRWKTNHLFSVHHITFFLDNSISTANRPLMEPYDFIQASRLINPVADGLSWHLINFMKEFKTPREFRNHAVPLIASSFILDHFPPGMHLFDPRQVFRVLYKDSCHKAIEGLETSPIGPVELAKAVSLIDCSFSSQFVEFQAAGSSRDWHEQQLAKRKDVLSQFKSEDTCFSCIRRRPQYTLPCGHMICQVCVRIFSSTSITDPWLVEVKACPVCTAPTYDLTIRLVPDTSRLRVLSIDGGGIRGAAPLGFLKALEDEVGIPNFAIQRHFDVKFGTSSGGLIVMSLDILGWTVDECLDYLKMFANKAFPPRSCILRLMSKIPLLSTFTRLTLFFFTLLTDSKYSADGLESLLMDTYGLHRGITDCSFASHIGSHVGVTLTRARDGAGFIATNYNQAGCRPEILDYSHLPSGCGQQAVKWWEVLRAATSAPYYFDGKRVSGHGIYQDGGLAFNNPASIALREAVALTPDGAEPSILLSLGTGSSAPLRKYLSIVYETFPFRVGRALWHRVSSRTSWDTLVGHRRSDSKCNLYRLDDDSEQENPLLDDVTQIDPVHQKAKEIAKGSPILPSLACSFRSALFYFQLDESQPPFFRNGRYECVGQILCRLRSPSVEYCSFMNRLWTNKATFHLEGQSVGVVEEDVYRNFQAVIHFSTMSLENPLPVRLIEGDTCHDISGSPFSIQWLVRRQKLDANFGTPEHKKRNNRETLELPSSKRLRVRY